MRYNKILTVLLLVSVLPHLVSSFMYTLSTGNCTNCIAVNTTVTGAIGGNIYYVGDRFYCYITVVNIGSNHINTTLIFKIFDPNGNSLFTGYGPVDIGPQENTTLGLYVNGVPGAIFMMSSGSYRIELHGSNITFYECANQTIGLPSLGTCLSGSSLDVYTHYFDVMPQWQKNWIDLNTQLLNKQIELSNKTTSLTEEIANLTKQGQESSGRVEILTYITAFLALVAAIPTIQGITSYVKNKLSKKPKEKDKSELEKKETKKSTDDSV